MEERPWPTLQSCKQKRSKATVVHLNDWLSLLPDEILLKIWSHLIMKEAARASLVSRKSKYMWLVHPRLNFEDKNAILRLNTNNNLILQERSTFIDRVNYIVEHHLGPVIDEFRVDFDLSRENHSHVDNWLVFAFAKQVKRLELVLKEAAVIVNRKPYDLKMPSEYQMFSNFGTFKPALTSLCLEFVHLTEQVIESFLDFFLSLEILCIRGIHSFTSIRACSSLQLKHLEVRYCENVDSIDLFVPHLLSFCYEGPPAELRFRNASSLSDVSIGSFCCYRSLAYAFDFISIYCAQLECLELKSNLNRNFNLLTDKHPVFTNLKHLTVNVVPDEYGSLLGWAPMIKACAVLQKLTLKLDKQPPSKCVPRRKIRKLDEHPLSCLKTLEIVGFLGYSVNLELVMYVIENAVILDEIVVDAWSPYLRLNYGHGFKVRRPDVETHKLALELVEMLPRSVKLIFRNLSEPLFALKYECIEMLDNEKCDQLKNFI